MAEVVCVGDLLIDFVPTVTGTGLVDAPAFQKAPGGAAANVAVGLARLGVASAFMGMVGEDPFGHFLADTLAEAGVDTGPLRFTPAARTALAFVSLRADGEREFMFYRHPSADMLFTPEEVDTGRHRRGKGAPFRSRSASPARTRARQPVRRRPRAAAGQLVSYDVNLRLPLWPDADGARSRHPGRPRQGPGRQAQRRRARVPDRQPRPRGRAQALARRAAARHVDAAAAPAPPGSPPRRAGDVPSFEVAAVDTTGAGDGFMAGPDRGYPARPRRTRLPTRRAWTGCAASPTPWAP